MATATADNPILIDAYKKLKSFLSAEQLGPYKDFLDDVDQYYSCNKDLFNNKTNNALIIAVAILKEAAEAANVDVLNVVCYLFSNYQNHRDKFNSYMKGCAESDAKKNITDDQIRQLQTQLEYKESLCVPCL